MECQRFQKLIKNWYLQVQAEAMAPARMVAFMERHLEECGVCLGDPGVRGEVKKIIELVLPAAKLRKPGEEPDEPDADEGEDEGTEDRGGDDQEEEEEAGEEDSEDDDDI